MVELPGPRILICVKMRIITALPEISDTASLNTGMLGVLDLDFDRGSITLGILLDMTIDKLLELKLPLFFFEVEGCVDFAMGSLKNHGYPEIVNGMYLQSFAPVIAVGQGGDRPIDASLGNAIMTDDASAAYDASKLPVVPIDAIPVLQFAGSPLVGAEGEQWPGKLGSSAKTSTYTEELKIAKGLDSFDGKIRMGDASYSFRVIEVSLEEKTPGSSSWATVD